MLTTRISNRNFKRIPWATSIIYLLTFLSLYETMDSSAAIATCLIFLFASSFAAQAERASNPIVPLLVFLLTAIPASIILVAAKIKYPLTSSLYFGFIGIAGLTFALKKKKVLEIDAAIGTTLCASIVFSMLEFPPLTYLAIAMGFFVFFFSKKRTFILNRKWIAIFLSVEIALAVISGLSAIISSNKGPLSPDSLNLLKETVALDLVPLCAFFLGLILGFIFQKINNKFVFLQSGEMKVVDRLKKENDQEAFFDIAITEKSTYWQSSQITIETLKRLNGAPKSVIMKMNNPIRSWIADDAIVSLSTNNFQPLAESIHLYQKHYELWMGALFRKIKPKKILKFADYCLEEGYFKVAFETYSYLRNLAPKNIPIKEVRKKLKEAEVNLDDTKMELVH